MGQSISNACRYSDPELDSVTRELQSVSSDSSDAVDDLWHQVQEKIVDDALSILVVFRPRVSAYDPEQLGNVESSGYSSGVPEIRGLFVKA